MRDPRSSSRTGMPPAQQDKLREYVLKLEAHEVLAGSGRHVGRLDIVSGVIDVVIVLAGVEVEEEETASKEGKEGRAERSRQGHE